MKSRAVRPVGAKGAEEPAPDATDVTRAEVTALETRLKEVNSTLRLLLTLYITWLTFLVSVNLATLAWLYGKFDPEAATTVPRRGVALVFALVDLFATSSNLVILAAALGLGRQADDVWDRMIWAALGYRRELHSDRLGGLWPNRLMKYAILVNAASMLALAAIWTWAVFH